MRVSVQATALMRKSEDNSLSTVSLGSQPRLAGLCCYPQSLLTSPAIFICQKKYLNTVITIIVVMVVIITKSRKVLTLRMTVKLSQKDPDCLSHGNTVKCLPLARQCSKS